MYLDVLGTFWGFLCKLPKATKVSINTTQSCKKVLYISPLSSSAPRAVKDSRLKAQTKTPLVLIFFAEVRNIADRKMMEHEDANVLLEMAV